MPDDLVTKCDENDPRRCQGTSAFGQCSFLALENHKFCKIHVKSGVGVLERKNITSLQLKQWQFRMLDHAEDVNVKSLRGEIGVLRMVLESILHSCNDDHELLLNSGRIGDLVLKLEKLVASCDRLEDKTALDKPALLKFAAKIIEIVGFQINDTAVLDRIGGAILKELGNIQSE